MSEITELERRITAALDRIAQGLETGHSAPADASPAGARPSGGGESDLAGLREALESERAANAQLSERVRAVKQRQETTIAQLERRLARLTEQTDSQSLELLRLKKANNRLVEANRDLLEMQQSGLSDTVVLNRAMAAELDALRAERRAEMAEMEEILSELRPLISEEANA